MRKALLILTWLTAGAASSARGQIFKEWFRQKKTQKEYLIAQIAALKVYKDALWTGYEIARDGLDLIGDIKNRDFNMHKDYFASLSKVSGPVKGRAETNGIALLHRNILITVDEAERDVAISGMLTTDEQRYLVRVFDRVRLDCITQQQVFKGLTTDKILIMKDDERIRRIDAVHAQMQDNLVFVTCFADEARVLALSRKQQQMQAQRAQGF